MKLFPKNKQRASLKILLLKSRLKDLLLPCKAIGLCVRAELRGALQFEVCRQVRVFRGPVPPAGTSLMQERMQSRAIDSINLCVRTEARSGSSRNNFFKGA